MSAIALAALASMFYGTADFMGGMASRRASVLAVTVLSQSAGLVVIVALALALGATRVATVDLAWGAAAGLTGVGGLVLLYRGLAEGPMSVVAPVTALCSVALPVAIGLLFGERPTWPAISGVVLAGLAVVLVSRHAEGAAPRTSGRSRRTALLTALASGTLIAMFLVCFQRTSREAGFWPLVVARLTSFGMVGLLIATRRGEPLRWPGGGLALAMPLVSGAIDNVANVLYTSAARESLLSVAAPVASLYPAATVVLARVVVGEPIARPQLAGLVLASLAMALMAM